MPEAPTTLMISVCGPNNFPLHSVRVTVEQGDFSDFNELFVAARKLNPELGVPGFLQGMVREGTAAVRKQIKAGKISPFMRERRA